MSVHADLEAASVRWDQRYRFDQVLELLEQVICQAHGPVGVVSDSAVNDLDLEHKPSVHCPSLQVPDTLPRLQCGNCFGLVRNQTLENYNMPRLRLGTTQLLRYNPVRLF